MSIKLCVIHGKIMHSIVVVGTKHLVWEITLHVP